MGLCWGIGSLRGCSSAITAGVLARLKMQVAVLQQAGQVAEITDRTQTLQLLIHVALFPTTVTPSHPIIEYSVLGHAVGSTELLHPASVVTVQHLLADARAIGAGTPGMILAARHQLMFEELFTAFTAEDQVLLVVAECVKEHFFLFTALTRYQDILLTFIQLTAHRTTEHRNTTLVTK